VLRQALELGDPGCAGPPPDLRGSALAALGRGAEAGSAFQDALPRHGKTLQAAGGATAYGPLRGHADPAGMLRRAAQALPGQFAVSTGRGQVVTGRV